MFFQRILHPTDFSDLSQRALEYAATLAQDHGGQLLILHAVETLGPENVTYGEAVSQVQPDGYRQRLWDDLRQVKPSQPGVPVEYILREEDPVTAILNVAAERNCDLIVLGTDSDGGFLKRLLLGSVVDKVVRKAPCPVLVVKPSTVALPVSLEEASDLHPIQLAEKVG